MKTVMNHSQDGGLLKMIRRTDPVIPYIRFSRRVFVHPFGMRAPS